MVIGGGNPIQAAFYRRYHIGSSASKFPAAVSLLHNPSHLIHPTDSGVKQKQTNIQAQLFYFFIFFLSWS